MEITKLKAKRDKIFCEMLSAQDAFDFTFCIKLVGIFFANSECFHINCFSANKLWFIMLQNIVFLKVN